MLAPRFPVLQSTAADADPSGTHASRGRMLRDTLLGFEARALGGDAMALRGFVLATASLATFERSAGRCSTAENELHRCLSVCMHLAIGHQDPSIDRERAAECAEWCAEALAALYEEHGLPAHADAVRRAARWVSRRVMPQVEA